MNKKTLTALKGSIRKWKGILAGKIKDEGTGNCPLCQLFNNEKSVECCRGCPVAERTGEAYCGGSPYAAWFAAEGYYESATNRELKRHAEAELKFLQSLLPKKRVARKRVA